MIICLSLSCNVLHGLCSASLHRNTNSYNTDTKKQKTKKRFLTAKKKAILLIFERSSIVHENICFGACR